MSNIPIIRLTLEGMKFELVSAVQKHMEAYSQQLDLEVEKAIQEFNFTAQIEFEVDNAIRQGLSKLIRKRITEKIWEHGDSIDTKVGEILNRKEKQDGK